MTTTHPAPATPSRASGPPRTRALAVVGVVLTVVGGIAGAAAAAVLVAFGSSGTLESGRQEVSTPTAALVTDVARIDDVHGIGGVAGWPTLRVSASSTGPAGVFIGIGPADAVADYLSGVAVDEVTDLSLDPFDLDVTRQPGTAGAAAPGDQDFWVAASTSHSIADLTWPVQDGDHRLVVMNADGTPGLTSLARVQLELPHAFPLSLAVLVVTGVLAVTGIALLVAAVTRTRRTTPS